MSDVKIHIEVKNLAEFKRAMRGSPVVVRKHLNWAINKAILNVGGKAAELVRKGGMYQATDTGRLGASILGGTYTAKKGSHGWGAGAYQKNAGAKLSKTNELRAEVGPGVDYAVYVHEGTRYMRARPFMYVALASQETEVNNYFEKGLQDALNEIASKV